MWSRWSCCIFGSKAEEEKAEEGQKLVEYKLTDKRKKKLTKKIKLKSNYFKFLGRPKLYGQNEEEWKTILIVK